MTDAHPARSKPPNRLFALLAVAGALAVLALVDAFNGGAWLPASPALPQRGGAAAMPQGPSAPLPSSPGELTLAELEVQAQREADLSALIRRPLFDPYRGVVPPAPPPTDAPGLAVSEVGAELPPEGMVAPAAPVALVAPSDLRLVGVLNTPSGPLAMFETGSGALRVRTGEAIMGFTLGSVGNDRAVLASPQGEVIVCLQASKTCVM